MPHVQSISRAVGLAATDTLSLAGVGADHTLLVGVRLSSGSDLLTSLSDSIDGLMPRKANLPSPTVGAVRTYVYAKEGCAAGDHDVIVNFSGNQTFRWFLSEYSESAIDVASLLTGFASGTSIVGPSVAPTVAGGTLVGIISLDSTTTIAPNNSETERQEVNTGLQLEDLGVAGLGPYTPTWLLGAARAGLAMSLVMKGAATIQLDDHTSFRGLARGMFRGF